MSFNTTSTLMSLEVSGSGLGAGVQADTITGNRATISDVSISVSATNCAVYNSGSGVLVLSNVRTRSGFGVNNCGTDQTSPSTILIKDNSDIDGVVQNAANGSISVVDSRIGFDTPTPEVGVVAYKNGEITLTGVTVYSASVGITAADTDSRIVVQGGSILSKFSRQDTSVGATVCTNVGKPGGGVLSVACI